MIDVMTEKDLYLAAFAAFEKEAAPPWLRRLRKAAIARFDQLGFPTPRTEDWKFTSVAPLLKVPFQLASAETVTTESLRPYTLPDCIQLVFVNGHYTPELSSVANLPAGLIASSLAIALTKHADKIEPHLARYAKYEEHAFTALNTAFVRDGAVLSIPKGVAVATPIHLLYVSTAPSEPTMSHPRSLVLAGANSQATVVESYVGMGEVPYFTNAVTEVVVGDNASINHYKLQQEGPEAFHVATLQIQHARSSRFSSHFIGLGGTWMRNEVRATLDAEGCECTINGLYRANGTQHFDNHTVIDHAKPHCASHELYKGILDGKSRGVFNGKIFVRQDAQKTDAKQTNQTLLLSDDATINTKPQLEIFADDVKCTHGATVGTLDTEAIFYLRTRGIGHDEARKLLTYAFANDLIGRIKVEALRDRLEQMLI